MSVASRNPQGLSEGKIKELNQKEMIPGPYYKPRRRREISLKEQDQIVNEFLKNFWPQKEIARLHRVSVRLVSDLVCERRNNPEKMKMAKAKEKELH